MRYMGGCTECFTVWWGCRCPLRCEECGCGYRADGASTCGTPGCETGQRRIRETMAEWDRQREAEAGPVRCKAIEPERGSQSATPSAIALTGTEGVSVELTPSPADEGGAVMTPPPSRAAERRRPAGKAHTDRRTPQPAHRPMAERRAAVEALLAEGLSDREIARRAGVSPSTVSVVRKGQEVAKIGA